MNDDTRKFWKTPVIGQPVEIVTHMSGNLMAADFCRRCAEPSDINELLPALYNLALRCDTIVEFGVRTGNSTSAFLAGLDAGAPIGGTLHSYDIEPPQCKFPPAGVLAVNWNFTLADTAHIENFPACDLLFIDTAHTGVHVTAELQYHAQVRKWIAFHDTVLYGEIGMDGKPGVLCAAREFQRQHPEWVEVINLPFCNGLLVLERKGAR